MAPSLRGAPPFGLSGLLTVVMRSTTGSVLLIFKYMASDVRSIESHPLSLLNEASLLVRFFWWFNERLTKRRLHAEVRREVIDRCSPAVGLIAG